MPVVEQMCQDHSIDLLLTEKALEWIGPLQQLYLLVDSEHAMLVLPPTDRAKAVFQILKRHTTEKQKPMESWKPLEQTGDDRVRTEIATYDFEWITSKTSEEILSGAVAEHLPYSYGITASEGRYWSWITNCREDLPQIYDAFLKDLRAMVLYYRQQHEEWLSKPCEKKEA